MKLKYLIAAILFSLSASSYAESICYKGDVVEILKNATSFEDVMKSDVEEQTALVCGLYNKEEFTAVLVGNNDLKDELVKGKTLFARKVRNFNKTGTLKNLTPLKTTKGIYHAKNFDSKSDGKTLRHICVAGPICH